MSNILMTIASNVDDLLIGGNNPSFVAWTIWELNIRLEWKDLGKAGRILDMQNGLWLETENTVFNFEKILSKDAEIAWYGIRFRPGNCLVLDEPFL